MSFLPFLAALLLLTVGTFAATPFLNTYLDAESRESLKKVFEKSLDTKDIASLHHGVSGLKMLGIIFNAAKVKEICDFAMKLEPKDLITMYHLSSVSAELIGTSCRIPPPKGAKEAIDAAAKAAKPSAQDLYYALATAKEMGLKVAEDDFATALTTAMKDGSASSLAYGLNAASFLEKPRAEKFLVRVEDLVGQADEVDGKYLQLEGGVSMTALGIHGIYALADKVNKSPNVKSDEAVKLANYLLSRRSVQMDRAAFLLLTTLKKLAKNNFQIPVSFSLASNMAVTEAQKQVRVRVCNVLGESVGPLSVNMDAATHLASKEVVATRKQLVHASGDATNTLYDLVLDGAKNRGFYILSLTAGSQDKRLVGTNGATVSVKLLVKVRVEDASVAVYDRELSKPTNLNLVKEGSKFGKVLDADSHSKMEIKFTLKEAKTGEAVTAHQAFVAFVNAKTKQEIMFVATPNSAKVYTFELDFSDKLAKEFGGVSGVYTVRLIIGDPAISHALDWNLADVKVQLPPVAPPKVKKSEEIIYDKLPEIQHMFREPEKRPPAVVSDTFTILCCVPLLILLVLWLRVGINFGEMPLSIWTPLFHIGLGGIFALYMLFWLRLDMFTTLKYLAVIGSFTFVAGNRLLRAIAAGKKDKKE